MKDLGFQGEWLDLDSENRRTFTQKAELGGTAPSAAAAWEAWGMRMFSLDRIPSTDHTFLLCEAALPAT